MGESCRACGRDLSGVPWGEVALALDRDRYVVGWTHNGHCATQWEIHIAGAGGFQGIGI